MNKRILVVGCGIFFANIAYSQYVDPDPEVDQIFTKTIIEYSTSPEICENIKIYSKHCDVFPDIYEIRLVAIKNKKYIRIHANKITSIEKAWSATYLYKTIQVPIESELIFGRPSVFNGRSTLRYVATLRNFNCPKKKYEQPSSWPHNNYPPHIENNPLAFTKKVHMIYELNFLSNNIKPKPNLIGKLAFDIRPFCLTAS